MKLYYIYQKRPKHYTELKELEFFEETIAKPTKANDTQWIDHNYLSMKKGL